MTHLYFHCVTRDGLLPDRCGSQVEDFSEAQERAAAIILACIARPGPEDWREWSIAVSDDDGDELFSLPFAAVLGRPH